MFDFLGWAKERVECASLRAVRGAWPFGIDRVIGRVEVLDGGAAGSGLESLTM
jgi:hypothetical protein